MSTHAKAQHLRRIDTGLPGVHVLEPCAGRAARTVGSDAALATTASLPLAASRMLQLSQDTLCGLHYPWPDACERLIEVTSGEVYAVAADIRRGSPTFAQRAGVMLTADNQRRLWIPEGFAHGLCTLSVRAQCTVQYTVTPVPETTRAIRWNDAAIAVDWPISRPRLSERDAAAPFLDDIPAQELPAFAG